MSYNFIISTLVLTLLIIAMPVSSTYLEMGSNEPQKSVYLGDEVFFNFTIKNNRALDDNVGFSIAGNPSGWVSFYPRILHVPGHVGATFSVGFFPTGEETGTFTYTIVATSYSSRTNASTSIAMDVLRPLDVKEFTAAKSGDELFLNILMNSKDEREAELRFEIINSRGEVLKQFSFTETINGETIIEKSIPLPEGILAGDYNVKLELVGTPVRKEYMITVPPVHMVREIVKKTSTAFHDDFEITIINEGNIAEPRYVTYKNLPDNDWVTGLITKPEECSVSSSGQRTCRYVFQDLEPGESATLSYRLDYTSIYTAYALVLIAVFIIVVAGMRRATAPVIIKRHVRKSGGRHHVVLEIRNPFYHNLSNTIIRDWVSPLANVLHHEINVLKPLIRRSDAGTELIWKLGDIRPKETRIITYPIKALVRGSLKMPKAYIRYNKPNGKLRRIFSKPLVINTCL